jgi:diguanylate cyclase (GGDEF)-like protein
MSFFQKRRWLVEFGVVCLVPIALIGVFLLQTLKSNVEARAIANAQAQARLVTDVGLATPLEGLDDLSGGLTSGQQLALDRQLATIRQGNGLQRALIRNPAGHVVWADDHSLIGQASAPAGAHEAAYGTITSSVASSPKGEVLRLFVPLRLGAGAPAGSAELWLPYAPITASIENQNGKIKLMLIAGLVLLWGTLLTVVTLASQRLRRQAAEKEEQALSDGLTGLPNRTMFTGLVQSTLTGAGRRKNVGAVMLMDLDRFKDVNDTLGHHNGDLLLQRIASRLDSVLRNTASVARLGGDEFAILLTEVSDRQAVVPVVRRILKVLEEPVVVGGLALQVEASIGIAMFPEHGRTVDAVMRAADVAMYVTKEQRSGYEFYDEERHEHRHDAGRLALIGELRRAMDETELVLFYQPKVDLSTGKVKGVEALARWHHPERGLLSPDEFIPLAERSNLLRPMTLYLIDTALRQANAWRSKGLEISVAVNLSMQNMLDLRLPNDLARLLTSWRLPAGSLELEITESTIMADHRRATTILSRLSKMGVRLSIDDFGTGYSSLAYLQELPVDAIKIDKSFVMAMHTDPGNATIVQSTVDLGHNLGLEVVAEGVETVEAYNTLAKLGCDYAQGFFLSKPLSPDKMSIWLEVFSGMGTDEAKPASSARERRELDAWTLAVPAERVLALAPEPEPELQLEPPAALEPAAKLEPPAEPEPEATAEPDPAA